MKESFLVPSYYKDFKCKGGDCRTCCCNGWAVTVSMKEYFELLSLECSPALRYKLDGALHILKDVDEMRYAQLLPSYTGDCPMRREDGLCGLQCECGEDALPSVCRYYPRSPRLYPYPECGISCSCEKVIEDLIASDEKLSFERAELDFSLTFEKTDAPEEYDRDRAECMKLLTDRTERLSRRLDKIFAFLDKGEKYAFDVNKIVVDMMEVYLRSPSIGEECERALKEKRDVRECEKTVREKFPSVEIWAEKILANHFFFEKFPFPERKESLSDVGKGLVGLCLLWLTLLADEKVVTKEDFVDVTGKVFRVAEHTRFYRNATIIVDRNMNM